MTTARGKKRGKPGARAAAARIVHEVLKAGRSLDAALEKEIDERWDTRDQSLIRALSYGALRWHHRNSLLIDQLLSKPLRAKDQILESLLSVGLFQLTNTRQPGYAAVSATVEAVRELRRPQAAGLVNATLRRFQREQEPLLTQVLEQDQGRYSHPSWLIEMLNSDWGAQAAAIMEFAQHQPPMWLRVNTGRISPERYVEQLRERAIPATLSKDIPGAVLLENPVSVRTLPGFAEGLVSVQDAAAQLAARMLAPEPGMRVLDACAAPGGKTGHLLELADGNLQLTAIDQDQNRNQLVQENLQRLGYTAEVVTADAEQWAANAQVAFDQILIDAPCSATGVIRRHPDIKYLRRATDIETLAKRQQKLLQALWPLLRPGGRLLYATCSILRAENQAVVSTFLEQYSDCKLVPLDAQLATLMSNSDGPGYQLLPGPANTDGFYYALMEKRS